MVQSTQNRAIILLITAVFCFSVMDASAKALSDHIGVLQAVWVRYAGQMAFVLCLVAPRLRSTARTAHLPAQLLRSILLAAATGFYFLGISLIPLADAAALMATNPVLITLGAALFLKEKLGKGRIIGIAIAMFGALLVLRPGSGLFATAALFPFLAAVCYSGYALLTRRLGPHEDPWTSLFYTGLVGTFVLSILVPFSWVAPNGPALALMAAIIAFGTFAQLCLIRAFSLGEAAMLAPYAYSGMVFAAITGLVFFGDVPDAQTLLGALVIAGAGLYVWSRETQNKA